jgi:dephospho-CoA kinase
MRVLGLLGGIASGKSFVAQLLVERGAVCLDADAAGHAVLREPDVKQLLLARWGNSISNPDGELNRAAIAAIVFAPTENGRAELLFLESISHPRIRAKLEAKLADLRQTNCPLAILDAPVMLKSGWDRLCDHVLYVHATDAIRLERARQRGWSEQQFNAREAAQESLAVKRKRSDFEVDNSGTADYTKQQIEQLWPRLIA